jgi:hypothetical protein
MEFVFELIWLIAEAVLFYTGELVLYVLSLGRIKPRWDAYLGSESVPGGCLPGLSVVVGLLFWLAAAAGVGFFVAS